MNEVDNKTIKDSVLNAIDSGKVTMKPKWHFVTKATLIVTAFIFATLSVLYLMSFIIFILHQSGLWFTPAFGMRGVRELLFGFPWLLVFFASLLIIIMYFLIKKYSFSYGKPIIYSVATILGIVIIGSFIISQTSVHKNLFIKARDNHLPIAGKYYVQYGMPPEEGSITAGEIIEILKNGFNINTPNNEILTVFITPQTIYPYGSDFDIGDKIIVIGDKDGLNITAYGIREVDSNTFFQPPRIKQRY